MLNVVHPRANVDEIHAHCNDRDDAQEPTGDVAKRINAATIRIPSQIGLVNLLTAVKASGRCLTA